MNNKIKLIALSAILSIGLCLNSLAAVKAPSKEQIQSPKAAASHCDLYPSAKSLDVVANPGKYLNKKITIVGKFDKFSTLGLDYKPAFRSSEKYITFLIKRDDVINHTVPLSEMKNFLKKEVAEKHIDLNAGDVIEYSGTVFSNALGDVWIDVENFKVLVKKPSDKSTVKK